MHVHVHVHVCVLVTYIQRKSDRLKQKERHKKYIDSKRKQIYGLRVVGVLRRASCTSKRKRAHMDLIRRHRESYEEPIRADEG